MHVTDELLRSSVERVGAGMGGPKARWDISLGAAQQYLREAVEELFILRAENREWICTSCSIVFPNLYRECPKCQRPTRPHALVREAAYKHRISDLESKIKRLEQSLEVLLDLQPSGDGDTEYA